MRKNILVLSGSPRRGGNSDTLCDQFVLGAREAGHQTEKLVLKDKKIGYCLGCGACSQRGAACPQQDDMAEILDKMIGADIIVMATPIYFYTMDAQMKTLIDRTCARYTEITGKEFYFIVTAADGEQAAANGTVDGFRCFTSCLSGAEEKGIIYGMGAWRVGEIKEMPAMQQAYDMGKNA